MSTIPAQTTMVAPPPSFLRRVRVPLAALGVFVLVFALRRIWHALDLDPAADMPLFMLIQLTFVLFVLTSLIWWLFFSGFTWIVRLAVLALILAVPVVGSFFYEFDFNGTMSPMLNRKGRLERAAALLEEDRRKKGGDQEDFPSINLTIGAEDFPRYRGPNVDGRATSVELSSDWTAQGPKILWTRPVGGGYAGFSLAGNVAVTIEQRRDDEVIACYDQATGRERWNYAYKALFHEIAPMGGDGPRATPTIADGDVYSLGAMGDLVCLDGANGALRWKTNILEDSAATNVKWAMTGSPLIVDEMVVVNPGINPASNAGKAVAAYHRKTGKRIWGAGDTAAGYGSPQLATLAGVPQILLFDAGGLVGINPKDGATLWRFPWKTAMDMNITQPVVLSGDRVFISSDPGSGSAMVQVVRAGDTWSTTQLWKNRRMYSRFANPVAHEGYIYGLCRDNLVCLADATGERKWQEGDFGSGQLLICGERLIIEGEDGQISMVAADPSGFKLLGTLKVFEHKTWNTPALAGNRLFVRNDEKMACIELPTR